MEGYISFENGIVEKSFYDSMESDLTEDRLLCGEIISIRFVCEDHVIDAGDKNALDNHNLVLNLKKQEPTGAFADVFFGQLSGSQFGHVLIRVKCVSSSMDVGHLLTKYVPDGLVVLADTQINGRGRGGTTWESPSGCAMFTFTVGYPLQSYISLYPAFLGYITSCSVVKAVQQLTGNAINLNIKWPNDIFSPRHSKIGGTLHDLIENGVIIGVGLNISNEEPAVCLNSLVKEHSKTANHTNFNKKAVDEEVTIEQFLIHFLKCFAFYFKQFQSGVRDDLLRLYFDSWIHQNHRYSNRVKCKNGSIPYDVIVKGLDSKGWLLVERVSDQSEESISPRGMSLDVLNGIIQKKPNAL